MNLKSLKLNASKLVIATLVFTLFTVAVFSTSTKAAAETVTYDIAAVADDASNNGVQYKLTNVVVEDVVTGFAGMTISVPSDYQANYTTPTGWSILELNGIINIDINNKAVDGLPDAIQSFLQDNFYLTLKTENVIPTTPQSLTVKLSEAFFSSRVDADGLIHYYEYIEEQVTWMEAYNAAKARSVNGLTGYLATITSLEEQEFIVNSISKTGGWLGATRAVSSSSKEMISNPDTVPTDVASYDLASASSSNWYWASGPEAGTTFKNGKTDGNAGLVQDQFNFWNTPGEPNNTGGTEAFMSYDMTMDSKWNDSKHTASQWVPGYLVEYSEYNGQTRSQESPGFAAVLPSFFTISYSLNYDTPDVPPASELVSETLFATPVTDPVRDGFIFQGWNTALDGSGVQWVFATTMMPGNDVTLYAQWSVDEKSLAKTDLDNAANDAKEAIDKLPNLTQAEKDAAKDAVDVALGTAKDAVDNATTPTEIEEAVTNGKDAINNVVDDAALLDAKKAAKLDLEAKAQEVRDAINALPGLSQEQKDAGILDIDAELENGLAAIDAGTSITEVENAYDTSAANMDDILNNLVAVSDATIQDAKDTAKADLEAKAQEVRDAINALPGLSQAQKDAGIADIDTELGNGLAAIDAGTTIPEIEDAYNTSATNMDNILANLVAESDTAMADAKTAAKNDLDDAANAAKDAIDSMPNLTDDEKAAAKDEVDVALGNAKDAVDNATTPTQIEDALTSGKDAINKVVDDAALLNAKNAAKLDLEAKAQEVRDAINALPGLSQEQKDAGIADIDAELENGLAAIDGAATIEEVEDAFNTSATNMDNILADLIKAYDTALEDAKNAAKNDLDDAANAAKDAIDGMPNLTDEEKTDAKDAVDVALGNAKDAVDAGTNPTQISDAVTSGKDAINNVVDDATLLDAKNGAKAELEAKAQEVKDAINALPGLSQDQKDAGIALIDSELENGLAAIDAGTNVLEIGTALDTSKTNMDNILANLQDVSDKAMDAARDAAIKDLEDAANTAKDIIDSLENLTPDEKAIAKDKIDSELAYDIETILSAQTPTDIDNIVVDGKDVMNGVVEDSILADAKNKAKADLEQKANDIINEINQKDGLTDEQKRAAIDAIKQELSNGLDAISNGNTVYEVQAAFEESVTNMNKILAGLVALPSTGQQFNIVMVSIMTLISTLMFVVSRRRTTN